jgi:hypothetical protein
VRAISDDRWRVSVSPRRIKPGKFGDRWLLGPKPPWPTTVGGWLWMLLDPPLKTTAFFVVLYWKAVLIGWAWGVDKALFDRFVWH